MSYHAWEDHLNTTHHVISWYTTPEELRALAQKMEERRLLCGVSNLVDTVVVTDIVEQPLLIFDKGRDN